MGKWRNKKENKKIVRTEETNEWMTRAIMLQVATHAGFFRKQDKQKKSTHDPSSHFVQILALDWYQSKREIN